MRAAEIRRHLPDVFLRTLDDGGIGRATLAVMEDLHAPSEAVLDDLDAWFDPRRAPDAFVPLLAGWVDLDAELAAGMGRLRELVAAAAEISRWRGTCHGLRLYLETATGLTGFRILESVPGPDGRPRPFHVRVDCPAEARPYARVVTRIVEIQKPVHVTADVHFDAPPGGP